MRFLVYPFDAEEARKGKGWFDSYARRRQLIQSISWLQDRLLEVYADGNYPYLYIMAKQDSQNIVIGFWNLFEDVIRSARIVVNLPVKDISFANCYGHREENIIVLDTPLYPYEFAGICCTRKV